MKHPWNSSERGASPIIGVSLLFMIVTLLAMISGGMFFSMSENLSQPPPMFAQEGMVEITTEDRSLSDQDMVLTHQGGTTARVENLELILRLDNGTVRKSVPSRGDLSDGKWSAGEQLSINLTESEICTGSDNVEVNVKHSENGRSYILGTKEIPIRSGGFTVENGVVTPVTDYTANVELLGTGFTYGAGGPNIDLNLQLSIGNESYTPWTGNINDDENPRSKTFADQQAGEAITVTAIADPDSEYISVRTRASNDSNGWVYVLRDGDTPPNIAGFGDQDDASSYVRPYLDGNNSIDIASNEAIYLFELGNDQTGEAADYQDVVVLVTLTTEEQHASTIHSSDGETVFYCPS